MIGARLRQLRNKQNLTLNDLAKLLKTTAMTLSRYENNQRQPDNETLKKIADFFDVSIDFLLNRTNIPDFEPLESNIVNIPIYNLSSNYVDLKIPVSSKGIATNSYDFVLDFNKLIGIRVFTGNYTPHFYSGDILLIELTEQVNIFSPYYLVKLDDEIFKLFELIGNQNKYIFAGIENSARMIFEQNKFTIIGRVITLIRNY